MGAIVFVTIAVVGVGMRIRGWEGVWVDARLLYVGIVTGYGRLNIPKAKKKIKKNKKHKKTKKQKKQKKQKNKKNKKKQKKNKKK